MSGDKAQEIINRAMADRRVYDAMAARENEVWGEILPALERSEARIEDTEASAKLGVARHQSSLFQVAQEKKLKFEHGLTLGCGAGRLERALIHGGVCKSFHGIDISERAIATAREISKEENLQLTYEVADLNFLFERDPAFAAGVGGSVGNRLRLAQAIGSHRHQVQRALRAITETDLVVAQTSLHHVLFLERVAEQVWLSLKGDGYLWIHDFIGETQGQYDPKRLSIMNQLLAILPEKFRKNKLNDRVTEQIRTSEPGHLASPFESIRSGEIIPVFQRWFTIEWKMEFSAFLHRVAPPGTRAAYLENEDTKTLFKILMLLDHLCIEEEIVRPTGGQYLMRPRAVDDVPAKSTTEG